MRRRRRRRAPRQEGPSYPRPSRGVDWPARTGSGLASSGGGWSSGPGVVIGGTTCGREDLGQAGLGGAGDVGRHSSQGPKECPARWWGCREATAGRHGRLGPSGVEALGADFQVSVCV
jgi:hypothetical protein